MKRIRTVDQKGITAGMTVTLHRFKMMTYTANLTMMLKTKVDMHKIWAFMRLPEVLGNLIIQRKLLTDI